MVTTILTVLPALAIALFCFNIIKLLGPVPPSFYETEGIAHIIRRFFGAFFWGTVFITSLIYVLFLR